MTTITLTIADNFSAGLRAFAGGVNSANQGVLGLNKGIESQQKQFQANYGAVMQYATVGLTALGTGVAYAIAQASEHEKVMAQTEAVIKSTGGAAGFTADEIESMAHSFQNTTAFSDDAVQSMQNVLLTFTSLKGDVVPQATQAILDMSTALGQDLNSTAIQVGKALQDPINGITALRRVGVNFSESQREVIKSLVETGQTAKAQALILKELNTEFGGSAAAAANTYAGRLAQAKNAVDDLAEAIGNQLIPPLTEAAKAMTLLLTGNEQIDAAVRQHTKSVQESATSYSAYTEEIRRTAKQAGVWVGTQEEANEAVRTGNDITAAFQHRVTILSEAEFEATNKTRGLNAAVLQIGQSILDNSSQWQKNSEAVTAASVSQEEAVTLLAAGMKGNLGPATQEFAANQRDAAAELKKVQKELSGLIRTQGQVVTVTKEATTSHAEIEVAYDKQVMAANKLSEAQAKLNENTDPDKQFAFQAAVNAAALGVEKADAAVNKFEEGMGSSSTAVVDNSKKIEELTQRKRELEAATAAARDRVSDLTGQFIFNQAAASLDAVGQLELAKSLGLIDEKSYKTSAAILSLNEQLQAGTISEEQFRAALVDAQSDIVNFGTVVGAIAPQAQVASDAIDRVNAAMAAAKDKTVTFTTNLVNNITDNIYSNNMQYVGNGVSVPAGQSGHAEGGTFRVPSRAGPRDSFPMQLKGGEEVTVKTPAQQRAGGVEGGVTIHGGIHLHDVGSKNAPQLVDELVTEIGRRFNRYGRSAALGLGQA